MAYDSSYLQQAAENLASNRKAATAAGRPPSADLSKFGSQMQSFAKGAKQLSNMRTPQPQVKPATGGEDVWNSYQPLAEDDSMESQEGE